MSRIGKQLIAIPSGVAVSITQELITIKGPKGELTQAGHPDVTVTEKDGNLIVTVKDPEDKGNRSLWGLYASLLINMIKGVIEGYQKQLEVNGVGFKIALSGKKLTLNVGFSHPVEYELPEGIEATVEKNVITISGINKQMVGEVAAQIRKIKKPEPYKGKGIKYMDEVIIRKAGKAAKTAE